jgi:hypothetical protein
MLHPIVLDPTELVHRLLLLDDHETLDPDPKLAVLVVARFVREDHVRFELGVVVGDPGSDSHRALVYVQEMPNTVACTVPVVCSRFKET